MLLPIFTPPRVISIHALLAESDFRRFVTSAAMSGFLSTLSLRRATPHITQRSASSFPSFLSTLSLRRATPTAGRNDQNNIFLSTLSLRRATGSGYQQSNHRSISIHALLAESDDSTSSISSTSGDFYPRSPCGERPPLTHVRSPSANISIHALLAESDYNAFNIFIHDGRFLSTLSLRRATVCTLFSL